MAALPLCAPALTSGLRRVCAVSPGSGHPPVTSPRIQQDLLAQTIAGIRSALDPQQAELIGGHTLEDRNPAPNPSSLGLQLVLSVQGSPRCNFWPKRGLQVGDQLLLSRPLGTGVLFAAAMAGAAAPKHLDTALTQMQTSQHELVAQLATLEQQHPGQLHAATDITGFGLLGHLSEMLDNTAKNRERLQVQLDVNRIPALPGALALLSAGHAAASRLPTAAHGHCWIRKNRMGSMLPSTSACMNAKPEVKTSKPF